MEGSICEICGERLPEGFTPGLLRSAATTLFDDAPPPRCGLCLRAKPPYEKAVAFGSYDGEVRDLIHLLKYEHVIPVTRMLAAMLGESLEPILPQMAAETIVIPVPLHRTRQNERGFNQSEAIVGELLKRLAKIQMIPTHDAEVPRRFRARFNILARTRPTKSQTGLTRHQRRANLRGAFAVKNPAAIAGRDVLLIDDVFTTGTTVAECSRVLMRAGAARVWVATVARVLKGDPAVKFVPPMMHPIAQGNLPEPYRPKDPEHSGIF